MNCFRKVNRSYQCKVVLLDGQELVQEIRDGSSGRELLDSVCHQLRVRETAYFGLRFVNSSQQPQWLDPDKKAIKQLKGTSPLVLYFCVMFYATDPCKLRDEVTRYQFFLQVKKDIVDGRLPVSPEMAAELGAYVVQSELGDFDPATHTDIYSGEFHLCRERATNEERMAEVHRTLVGQTPAEAESVFLEKVRWLDMYGVDLYPVLGEQHAESFIGLAPSGVLVLKGKEKVSSYFWPRITKVFCKKNNFMLRVRDKDNEEHTFGFETPSRSAGQLLLRSCSEQRQFFLRALAGPPADAAALPHGGRSEGRRDSSARSTQRQVGRRAADGGHGGGTLQHALLKCGSDGSTTPVCHKTVSVPQPVQSASSLYRASSVGGQSRAAADSPRSARSVPISASELPGLFSAGGMTKTRSGTSMDSQSSVDSRTQRRQRHRRESSVGSDASSGQGSLRSSRRYRGRRAESGSDSDRSGGSRRHRSRRHRHHHSNTELVDSEPQWREVQRRQAERLRPSGYQNSGMETETELTYQPRRRVKKHSRSRSRSRSRSPETGRNRRLPAELRRHLQFGLVDPSAGDAGDIPYTKVTTEVRMPRVRYAAKRSQKGSDKSDTTVECSAAAPSPEADPLPEEALSPAEAYPSPAGGQSSPPRPPAGTTLSSYYVRGGGSGRGRQADVTSDRVSSGAPMPDLLTTTADQVSRAAEHRHDNSDSGLGNESPSDFTRTATGSPSSSSAGSRAVTAEPRTGHGSAETTREEATAL